MIQEETDPQVQNPHAPTLPDLVQQLNAARESVRASAEAADRAEHVRDDTYGWLVDYCAAQLGFADVIEHLADDDFADFVAFCERDLPADGQLSPENLATTGYEALRRIIKRRMMTAARRSGARVLIDWTGDRQLGIVKMLAWTIQQHEHLNLWDLSAAVQRHCEPVIAKVTGDEGVTFGAICRRVADIYGVTLTPHRLMQRADKTQRYGEFTPDKDAVVTAYESLVSATQEV